MKFRELWSLLFVFCLLLCSCNDMDGDWESMKWSAKNLSPEDIKYNKSTHEIKVSPNGGSIKIVCKNYPSFWFDMPYESPEPPFKDCKGEWYDLSIKQNVMICKFSESGTEVVNDTLNVTVSAGDIFSYFTIIRTSM